MAAFEAHEPTVLSMLSDLDNLLTSLGVPVDTAIEQLEISLMQAKLQPELVRFTLELIQWIYLLLVFSRGFLYGDPVRQW